MSHGPTFSPSFSTSLLNSNRESRDNDPSSLKISIKESSLSVLPGINAKDGKQFHGYSGDCSVGSRTPKIGEGRRNGQLHIVLVRRCRIPCWQQTCLEEVSQVTTDLPRLPSPMLDSTVDKWFKPPSQLAHFIYRVLGTGDQPCICRKKR